MTFEFTPHPPPMPKKGDIWHVVQTYCGKTTIEHVRVHLVSMKKVSCVRLRTESYKQISFYRQVQKDGSHEVALCKPFCQNTVGYPDSKKELALAEFYRRGGKDA